jgi:hypothetical protein
VPDEIKWSHFLVGISCVTVLPASRKKRQKMNPVSAGIAGLVSNETSEFAEKSLATWTRD